MPNIITQSVIKAKNQNSKKTAQPTNPVGRVRHILTSRLPTSATAAIIYSRNFPTSFINFPTSLINFPTSLINFPTP